jgi:hypothetical protein
MAIATGTAALIAAGIAAGGTVAATKIQSNAANKAARLQRDATRDALDYEREQDQYVRSRYEKEDAREDEARRLYQQYLAANGKGPAPGTTPAATAPTNMDPVAVAARAAVSQPGYSSRPAQPTLRDMAPAPSDGPALTPADMEGRAPVAAMPTLADTSRWSEWEPYLRQNQA